MSLEVDGKKFNKIAIAGYGTEGKSNFKYFKTNYPDCEIEVFDESNGDKLSEIPNDYLIIRSPGISPKKLPPNASTWSSTNQFFSKCQAKIIGITGTKGKGTTSSLIYYALNSYLKKNYGDIKNFPYKVYLLGNIGVPPLDFIDKINPEDIVIFELSSFQLWDLRFSPHIALLTNFEPDHLDIHSSLHEYKTAKANIVKFQTDGDYVVFNRSDINIKNIANCSSAKKFSYPSPALETKAKPTLKLIGHHNLVNACGATKVLELLGIKNPDFSSFSGLEHRLKFVSVIDNISFYDDSIATTPTSAFVALKSFPEPKILILGGKDKGANYDGLGASLKELNVLHLYVIGENQNKIFQQVSPYFPNITKLNSKNMMEIVEQIYQETKKIGPKNSSKIVILSPAAASFDMFKSYQDRGNQFIEAVNSLHQQLSLQ